MSKKNHAFIIVSCQFEPRSTYLIIALFSLFFQSEKYFSLTTIQPEQYFSANSAKFYQAERGLGRL